MTCTALVGNKDGFFTVLHMSKVTLSDGKTRPFASIAKYILLQDVWK